MLKNCQNESFFSRFPQKWSLEKSAKCAKRFRCSWSLQDFCISSRNMLSEYWTRFAEFRRSKRPEKVKKRLKLTLQIIQQLEIPSRLSQLILFSKFYQKRCIEFLWVSSQLYGRHIYEVIVSFHIHSKYGEIWTRLTPNTD